MSAIQFYNLQSAKELIEGKMLYLDHGDGFDEDFCSSSREGDEIRLLQKREPGIPLFALQYATCEVKKADYSGIEATITSVMTLDELIMKMPVQDNFSIRTIEQFTQSYLSRHEENDPRLLEKLPFNLPQKSMIEEARTKTEILAEQYHNARNTLYIRYLPSDNAFRVLYLRNDERWYNLIYDLFRADDMFRDIEKHSHGDHTETVKAYWQFFLH
jgi:hypothetical protein